MAFTPRTDESGIYDNPYWYDLTYNPGAKDYIWLPNCTTYAYGRSVEISGGQVTRTTIFGSFGFHNAANWYSEALWDKTTDKSQVALGDILVWGQGGSVTSSAGHVAVVEQITDSYVYASMSDYQYDGQTKTSPATNSKRYFSYGHVDRATFTKWTRDYNYNSQGTQGTSYADLNLSNFIGLIHNPYAGYTPDPVKSMSISPSSKTIEVPIEGISFTVDVSTSGTPLEEGWNSSVMAEPTIGNLTLISGPFSTDTYKVNDKMYFDSAGTFTVRVPHVIDKPGNQGRFYIHFRRYNFEMTEYDLSRTLTIDYRITKEKGIVMFLNPYGTDILIR